MPNVVTEMLTRDLQESLGSAEGMIFVSYEGLSMSENEELRNEIATKSGAEFRMLRNKLASVIAAPGSALARVIQAHADTGEDAS